MIRTILHSVVLLCFLIVTTFIAFTVMYISIEEQAIVGGLISLIMVFIVSSICTKSIVRIKRNSI
ncbi:hypothetical protein MKY91_03835 [Alkalicoccobacillus gibsonii]|uniref:Uncharacterized protein n=1 Tax=Alkalicoccobacillus gibsonii TaxID=79881 RepID=A0ABU9VEF5_9BACI